MSLWSALLDMFRGPTHPHRMNSYAYLDLTGCPCCETTEPCLLAGPSGGMSTNVMCKLCGARYNLTMLPGLLLADFTHGPQPNVWGGATAQRYPAPERVTQVQQELSDGR